MKTKLFCLFAFVLVFTASFELRAQGTAFTYQGRLNGTSGPATGSYDFLFVIYDSVADGNAVSTPVTNSAVSVSNGLFTTTIDFGSTAFTGDSRWLDISVRTNGSSTFFTLSPRQAFTPTPYSITAATITGPVSASQLTGTVPSTALAGTYNNQVTLNNANNQFAGVYSGNGANLTNLSATKLTGTVGSAQLAGTYSSALTLNNAANSYNGTGLSISGNKTGGWGSPVAMIQNTSTVSTASPALRVLASGTLADGALNVSANGSGLIARFGNASTWVADVTTNGTVDAVAFSGNGSALTALNASQLTSGTLPSSQLSGTYSSALTFNNQSDNFTGAYNVSTNGFLRLGDRPLYLRPGGDGNHGLAYSGNGITNFGTGNVQVDGPVLWGFSGGALGVVAGGEKSALTWNSTGVTVNGTLTATNTPGINYQESNNSGLTYSNAPQTVATVTAAKPAPGYFFITAYISAGFNNNNTLYMALYDTTAGTAFLTESDVQGSGWQNATITWVVPITTSGGTQTFTLKAQTDTGTAIGFRHNLSVVYIPRLN